MFLIIQESDNTVQSPHLAESIPNIRLLPPLLYYYNITSNKNAVYIVILMQIKSNGKSSNNNAVRSRVTKL